METAMREGADLVGGMPHWELDPESARSHVEFCFDLAERYDADIDMHVDETDDPRSRTLEMVIDATERHGFGGRVTALLMAHAAPLLTPEEIDAGLRMIRHSAAEILRLPGYGLVEGARAELVVLDADSELDALRLLPPRRWTIHEGRVVAETLAESALHRSVGAASVP